MTEQTTHETGQDEEQESRTERPDPVGLASIGPADEGDAVWVKIGESVNGQEVVSEYARVRVEELRTITSHDD